MMNHDPGSRLPLLRAEAGQPAASERDRSVVAESRSGTAPPSIWARLIDRLLVELCHPPLQVELWTGEVRPVAIERPVGRIRIRSARALLRLAIDPHLQFGECYSRGDMDLEGDLPMLLEAIYRGVWREGGRDHWLRRLAMSLHRVRTNTLEGARANIHHHYDIGNAFYAGWLGPTMAYTCAYYPTPQAGLDAAQFAKMEHVCRKLRLRAGETLVEAGCGWGSLALHAARHHGVRVRAFNISREQIAWARERARAEGLERHVEFVEDDYRNATGPCDAFVSVGMLEHVGVEHYPELGRVVKRLLGANGRGLIHTIGRSRPAPMNPWIERRIFPGANPPSLGQLMQILEPFELAVTDVENLRPHYARTLTHWLEAFEASSEEAARRFDERFVRMWRLYLAGSIASFRTGDLQLFQVCFATRGNDEVPWTRDFLYDAQAHAARAGALSPVAAVDDGGSFDVLVVGGGPAGSTCARALVAAGFSVAVLDKAVFPRDKVCAGWVTPQVMQTLGVDPREYVRPAADGTARTLQPVTGFRTGLIGATPVDTAYGETVSYAIRRCEFDHYLLERSGAQQLLGEPLRELTRDPAGWQVNGRWRATLLVGAGGHFCPVAKMLGAAVGSTEPAVAAQEVEYLMDARQAATCAVAEDRPELYFCPDLKGYGWVVRKGDWLNVGLGRDDRQRLAAHVAAFCDWLRRERRVPQDLPSRFHGHAYLLYPQAPRRLGAAGVLLVGDAAGLAYPQSGEGIRPAVESGVLAAQAIVRALAESDPAAREAALAGYSVAMAARFGARRAPAAAARAGAADPAEGPADSGTRLRARAARWLLARSWFARHVVIDRWFLHRQQAALPEVAPTRPAQ